MASLWILAIKLTYYSTEPLSYRMWTVVLFSHPFLFAGRGGMGWLRGMKVINMESHTNWGASAQARKHCLYIGTLLRFLPLHDISCILTSCVVWIIAISNICNLLKLFGGLPGIWLKHIIRKVHMDKNKKKKTSVWLENVFHIRYAAKRSST